MTALVAALLAVVGGVWLLLAARRLGVAIALSGTIASGLLLLFWLGVVSNLLRIALPVVTGLAAITLLGVGVVLLIRMPRPQPRARGLQWLPVLLGPTVWLVGFAIAHAVPGSSTIAWAMNADAANNTLFARRILENGLAVDVQQNPVPMPAMLIATIAAPGRGGLDAGALLQHDVGALGWTWVLFIALTGAVSGAIVHEMAVVAARPVRAIGSAVASLLPLGWYVGTAPADFGYLNLHIALPVLLAAWLAFLGSLRRPQAATIVLVALTAVVLTLWTPLALVTGLFAVVVFLRNRPAFAAPDLSPQAVVAGALAVASVLFALLAFTLPGYVSLSHHLSVDTRGFPLGWPALGVIVPVVLVLARVTRRGAAGTPVFTGVVTLVAASAAAIGLMYSFAVRYTDPWTAYYPSKLSWLLSVVFGVILLGLLTSWFASGARLGRFVAATAAIATTAAALALPIGVSSDYPARPLLGRILSGDIWRTGDAAAHAIFDAHGRYDQAVYWRSGNPDEAMITFWLLQVGEGSFENAVDDTYDGADELREFSFAGYREFRATGRSDTSDIDVLCRVIESAAAGLTVVTADNDLGHDLALACPAASRTVTLAPAAD